MKVIILNKDGTTYEAIAFAWEIRTNIFGYLKKSYFYILDKSSEIPCTVFDTAKR